ncbi:hypothetical protein ACHHYP_08357 [Achlya hypogyna]|uniref:FH2 domain-containing protein n=1 Tax=Achlya hypogyna TaxID=1202772 RepID=A0A1V9ZKV3_ACHHY|nr:hypothetical protein ACHHYP_08357 [Achlya hypogyna]
MGGSFSCPGVRTQWSDLSVTLSPPADDTDVDDAYLHLVTHRGVLGVVRQELARIESRDSKWQQTQLFQLGHVASTPTSTECIHQLQVLHYRRERAHEYLRLLRLVVLRARRRWVRLFVQDDGLAMLLSLLSPAFDADVLTSVLDLVLLLLSFVSVLEHFVLRTQHPLVVNVVRCLGPTHEIVSIKVLQVCRLLCLFTHSGHIAVHAAMDQCFGPRVVGDVVGLLEHGSEPAREAVLRLLHALLEGEDSPQLHTFAHRLVALGVPAWLAQHGDEADLGKELDTAVAFEATRCQQLLRRFLPPPDHLQDAIQHLHEHARAYQLEAAALKVVTALLSVTEPAAWEALVERMAPAPVAPVSPRPTSMPATHHPRFAKYFRMLEVQVPKDLVRQRMLADGVDTALLDAPQTIVANAAPTSPPTSPVSATPKGLLWHKWSDVRGTIFEATPTGKIDADDVHVAFQMRSPIRRSPSSPTLRSPSQPILLHPRRAKHIRKLLDQHHLTLLKPSIADALISGKVDALTYDMVTHVRHVLALPTAEEKASLAAFTGNVSLLQHPEGVLHALVRIPGVDALLDLLATVLKFDTSVQAFERDCTVVQTACRELTLSTALHQVLGYVLDLGNHINAGTPRGNALGFNLLTDLHKLEHVRQSAGGSTTALHFLASVLRSQDATLLAFPATLPSLETVAKSNLSSSELTAQLQGLHAQVQFVAQALQTTPPQYCLSTFTMFLNYSAAPLARCDATWTDTAAVLESTMLTFLKLPKDTLSVHSSSFFLGIHQFAQALERADRENCEPLVLRKAMSLPPPGARPPAPHRSHSMAS